MRASVADSEQWLAQVLNGLHTYYWTESEWAGSGSASEAKRALVELGESDDWRPALAAFYRVFAFQRAGAPPSWGPIAGRIIGGLDPTLSIDEVEGVVWEEFKARIAPGKTNPRRNPLFPNGAKPPATRFVARIGDMDHNILRWAAARLRSGDAFSTWHDLRGLQAIGQKIASFFLRDIATSYGIQEGRLDDRTAIFPVDVWVRRGVAAILGDRSSLASRPSDASVAASALGIADDVGVTVAALNAGLWVLGARFARSPSVMVQALTDRSKLQDLVAREVRHTGRKARALQSLQQDVGD
jgi:hypothetical protein